MYKNIIFITILTIFITGCASSTGNQILKREDRDSVSIKITKEITTKGDIRQMFGDPVKTLFINNGSEVWSYSLLDVSADLISYIPIPFLGSSISGTKKQLIILFDKNDVVKKYSMSSSDVAFKSRILNHTFLFMNE